MIKIKKSDDNQYYYVVYAKNGEPLVTSETFKRKQKAYKSVGSLEKVFQTVPDVIDETGEEDGKAAN